MTEPVSLQVDKTIIEGVIRERIAAAVVKELGSADQLMAKAIELALTAKVDQRGQLSSSSYENKYTFLEALAGNAIRDAARQAVKEWTEANKGRIHAAVMAQLKGRQTAIAKALVDKFAEKASSDGLSVTISVLDERRY